MIRDMPPTTVFPTDGPIPAASMVGRARDVTHLIEALRQGSNQIVGGPRRTGKTTACRAAVSSLTAAGHYTVSVDLFELGDLTEFADIIIRKTVANRPPIRRAIGQMRLIGRSARDLLVLAPVLRLHQELGMEIDVAFGAGGAAVPAEERLDTALKFACRLAEVDGKRLVLYVDEAQELGERNHPFGDPDRITKRMRSILQDAPHVVTLFSGSQEHLLRDLFTPRQRAFYGWAGWTRLGPITADEWGAGLRQRFGPVGLGITETGLERLVGRGEGHPRSTMLLAQQASIEAVLEGTTTVDDAVVELGWQRAMAADYALHQEIGVELRAMGRHVPRVARRIAEGLGPYGQSEDRQNTPASVARAVDVLARSGLIEQRGAKGRGGWVVIDPLIRRFLAGV
ncbi:MAG: ATP-binding protein [Actinobacteria bacterium]|nr:ATP-binding protein [Actinomycetota bacterium]